MLRGRTKNLCVLKLWQKMDPALSPPRSSTESLNPALVPAPATNPA